MNVSHYPAGQASPFFISNPTSLSNNSQASGASFSFPSFARKTSVKTDNRHIDTFSESTSEKESPAHRFPQRLFAFSSDLGLLSAFLKLPVLAWAGWLIVLPYYAFTLIRQPDKQSRKEEALYQVTANGIFPLAEAKLGVLAGKNLSGLAKQSSNVVPKLSPSAYKAMGGLLSLLILTPTIGDKLSHKIVSHYQEKAA